MHALTDAQQYRARRRRLRPLLGSGTTLIAAESCGRLCRAMEVDPRYVDVAVRRWQAFTGKVVTLDSDGRTFEALSSDRVDIELAVEARADVCTGDPV